ncbi:MAG: hypothetical protein RL670_1119 [Actinomycetota bacterium]
MEPVRTCVGCRQRSRQLDLLRVVVVDQVAVIDFNRNQAGRGAWVHPTGQCLKTAIERGSLIRALRETKAVNTQQIAEQAEKMLAK